MDQDGDQASEHACHFAALLSTARRAAGLTQQALARATNLPRSLISELEHARTPVRLAHAQALAAVLATSDAEREQWLAGVHPAAGTRRWGPLTGISTALEEETLARLRAGLTDGEVAAALGISPAQVASVRRHRRQPPLTPGERTARLFADLDRAIIADYQAGVPYAAIVERYDVPRSTLYELLAQQQIPRRRRTGGRRRRAAGAGGAAAVTLPRRCGTIAHTPRCW